MGKAIEIEGPIIQVDIETNEFIDQYNNIEEAAEDNWLKPAAIVKALNERDGVVKKRKVKFMLLSKIG